jgi:tetratricopeptide (TPR) repeat protein
VILPIDAIPSQAKSALDWGKELSTELEVDVALLGSIRHSGNQLRISIQMIRTSDSRCLWSDRFDAKLDCHFDVQAELALRITQALPDCQVHCMRPHRPRANANSGLAMHACSLGYHSWQLRKADALRKAVNYFSDAIELDPLYADAYAGLADTYISLSYGHLMSPQKAASSALKAIQSALKLDRHSIKVINAHINWLIHCSWNLPAAEKLCRKMIDSGRMDARTVQLYSSIMILSGRHQESIRLALQACQLAPEPEQVSLNGQVALAYFYSADYGRAITFVQRIIELQPQYMMGYAILGRAESQLGNWDKAVSAFTKGVELSQGSPFNRALLASAYAGSKEVSKAHAILDKLSAEEDSDDFPAFDISAAYAVLQQEKEALRNFRRAIDRRDVMTVFAGQDPRFSRLRNSAGYRQIISNISPSMIPSATV